MSEEQILGMQSTSSLEGDEVNEPGRRTSQQQIMYSSTTFEDNLLSNADMENIINSVKSIINKTQKSGSLLSELEKCKSRNSLKQLLNYNNASAMDRALYVKHKIAIKYFLKFHDPDLWDKTEIRVYNDPSLTDALTEINEYSQYLLDRFNRFKQLQPEQHTQRLLTSYLELDSSQKLNGTFYHPTTQELPKIFLVLLRHMLHVRGVGEEDDIRNLLTYRPISNCLKTQSVDGQLHFLLAAMGYKSLKLDVLNWTLEKLLNGSVPESKLGFAATPVLSKLFHPSTESIWKHEINKYVSDKEVLDLFFKLGSVEVLRFGLNKKMNSNNSNNFAAIAKAATDYARDIANEVIAYANDASLLLGAEKEQQRLLVLEVILLLILERDIGLCNALVLSKNVSNWLFSESYAKQRVQLLLPMLRNKDLFEKVLFSQLLSSSSEDHFGEIIRTVHEQLVANSNEKTIPFKVLLSKFNSLELFCLVENVPAYKMDIGDYIQNKLKDVPFLTNPCHGPFLMKILHYVMKNYGQPT